MTPGRAIWAGTRSAGRASSSRDSRSSRRSTRFPSRRPRRRIPLRRRRRRPPRTPPGSRTPPRRRSSRARRRPRRQPTSCRGLEMKRSDRTIFIVLPVIALVVAYWMLVLSPKREEASKLDDEVAALEAEVAQAEQTADVAEQARASFDEDYQKVVTLGKAVPEDDDTASLITQI